MCCSVLQCVEVCHIAMIVTNLSLANSVEVATLSVLQFVAVCCIALRFVAACCGVLCCEDWQHSKTGDVF